MSREEVDLCMMSDNCVAEDCRRKAVTLCLCCKENLCREHFDRHQNLAHEEFNAFMDQFNTVNNRVLSLKVDDIVAPSREQLKQWRDGCIQQLNKIFEQKCKELEQNAVRSIEVLKEDAKKIRSTWSERIERQDADRQTIKSGKDTIQQLEEVLDIMERIPFKITTRPLRIDQTSIEIEEVDKYRMKLLAFESIYKSIGSPEGSYTPVASSDQFLLCHQKPDLCLLDRELKEIKRNKWKNDKIESMCWSTKLEQFVVITKERIFLVSEDLKSIKSVQVIRNSVFNSCTCSDTALFVSTYELGSSIFEFKLLPGIELDKEWKSPDTCEKGEWITDISYHNGSMALVIKNTLQKTCRIEVIDPNNFQRTWRCQIKVPYLEKNIFALCSLADDGWLVLDYNEHQVLYFTWDGVMRAKQVYNGNIRCTTLFGSDLLAVTTDEEIHLHKF